MKNYEDNLSENDRYLWQRVFETETDFYQASMDFMANATNRVAVVRHAFSTRQRGTALRLLLILPMEERLLLFDELVEMASHGHSDIELVREAILSLPREWVIANIESRAEPWLQAGEDEYRRYLELYYDLDKELTLRLAQQALRQPDPETREAGEDFLERLNNG